MKFSQWTKDTMDQIERFMKEKPNGGAGVFIFDDFWKKNEYWTLKTRKKYFFKSLTEEEHFWSGKNLRLIIIHLPYHDASIIISGNVGVYIPARRWIWSKWADTVLGSYHEAFHRFDARRSEEKKS